MSSPGTRLPDFNFSVFHVSCLKPIDLSPDWFTKWTLYILFLNLLYLRTDHTSEHVDISFSTPLPQPLSLYPFATPRIYTSCPCSLSSLSALLSFPCRITVSKHWGQHRGTSHGFLTHWVLCHQPSPCRRPLPLLGRLARWERLLTVIEWLFRLCTYYWSRKNFREF